MDRQKFYDILYDSDDYIAVKNRKKKDDEFIFIKNNASVQMMQGGFPAEYICINPVDVESDGSATSANIYTYRNILMEEDGGIPIDEQRAKIAQSGLPYSTVVFSGNESAHHIISLETPLKDEDEYVRWFKAIEKVLATYNFKADAACKNPSRLSRAADGINFETGNTQDILELRSRVKNETILEWFKVHDAHPDEFIVADIEYTSFDGPDSANDERRWEVAKKLMGSTFDYNLLGDGEREPARFQLALRCKECRLSESAAINYMAKEFPSSGGDRKVAEGVKRVYKTREVTYKNISSTEDWIKLKEAEKKEETWALFDNLMVTDFKLDNENAVLEDEVITDTSDAELHRYIMVGDTIYFVANRRLYKRSLQTFTLHFPKRELINVRRFTDFCNEPGYFNYEPIINNKFNSFKMPTWKPRKGDWSTIEHYLRHITDGSDVLYEMMLDYLQISLENPKEKLPILILMSYEKGSGKSTFFDLLHAIFGENVEPVTPNNFELDWNTQWCEKHFIFIDEMEKIKDTEKVGGKLKNLAYFPVISKNKKGHDTITIPWHGKIVLTSNQEGGFIEIDAEEDRYLILKVPQRTSFNKDYVSNMVKQVPHLIHYLMHRELHSKKLGRGWFSKEQLHTKALQAIVHNSRPQIDIDIERFVTDWFESHTNKDEMNFLIKDVVFVIGSKSDDRVIKDSIHKLWGIINDKKYTAEDSCNGFEKKQKNWYTIKREIIMTNDDLNESIADTLNDFI